MPASRLNVVVEGRAGAFLVPHESRYRAGGYTGAAATHDAAEAR